jgi:hypothetical protein
MEALRLQQIKDLEMDQADLALGKLGSQPPKFEGRLLNLQKIRILRYFSQKDQPVSYRLQTL